MRYRPGRPHTLSPSRGRVLRCAPSRTHVPAPILYRGRLHQHNNNNKCYTLGSRMRMSGWKVTMPQRSRPCERIRSYPAAWRGASQGERSGPPPRLAVEGRSNGHGPMLPISDVTYVKPMLLPHGGWPMAAGPVSRLGSCWSLGIKPGCGSNHTLHLAHLIYYLRSVELEQSLPSARK